jgi:recombination protein RecT
MSKEIAVRQNIQTVIEWLDKEQPRIIELMPKNFVDPKQWLAIALMTLKSKDLANCTIHSLTESLLRSARLGLFPDGLLGHCYLIPFGNSKLKLLDASGNVVKDSKGKDMCMKEATMMVGYKGMGVLAMRSKAINGLAKQPSARPVYEGDDYHIDEGADTIHHVRSGRKPKKDEHPILCYAKAVFSNGYQTVLEMFDHEIEKIRDKSPAAYNGPWVTHYEAMACKTVLRRLYNRELTLDPDAARQLNREEYEEETGNMYGEKQLASMPIRKSEFVPAAPTPDEPETIEGEILPEQDVPIEVQPEPEPSAEEEAKPEEEVKSKPKKKKESDLPWEQIVPVYVTKQPTANGGIRYGIKQADDKWNSTFDAEFGRLATKHAAKKKPILVQREFNAAFNNFTIVDMKEIE